MRNAWRLGLVLMCCSPAFAPEDRLNPYAPPLGLFNLERFWKQVQDEPNEPPGIILMRKEWTDARAEYPQGLGDALLANPGFLEKVDRKTALTLLELLTVAEHHLLMEHPSVIQSDSLRDLVREGRILSYLKAGNRFSAPNLLQFTLPAIAAGSVGYMTLAMHWYLSAPAAKPGTLADAYINYGMAGIAVWVGPLLIASGARRALDAVVFQMMLARLRSEAQEVGADWQPSPEFFNARPCGLSRLLKSPLRALRPK